MDAEEVIKLHDMPRVRGTLGVAGDLISGERGKMTAGHGSAAQGK